MNSIFWPLRNILFQRKIFVRSFDNAHILAKASVACIIKIITAVIYEFTQ